MNCIVNAVLLAFTSNTLSKFKYVFFCKLKSLQKMRNKRKLLIEQLDQKLKPFLDVRKVLVSDRG